VSQSGTGNLDPVTQRINQLNTHDTPLLANSTDIVDDSDWGWFSSAFTQLV